MAIYLLIALIGAGVCGSIASAKGRNPIGWGVIGFLAPLLGLILILVMSDLKAERRRVEELGAERRRLKEQLRQEKLKSESFRRYATERIDTHDRVLGVDTKRSPTLGAGAPPPVPGLPRADLPDTDVDRGWYYERGGQQNGPVPRPQLEALLASGELGPKTLVWTESMEEWTPAQDVPDLGGTGRS
ncbi:MAG: GYF domain-containing protein [Planctomycetota bacterium]